MSADGPGREHRHRVVCKDGRMPPGWVVIAECHNAACPGEGANAWVVKRPATRELVCAASPLPEGWVRVRPGQCSSCPGDGDNAWIIERVDEPGEPLP